MNIIGGSGFIGTRLCQRLKDSGKSFRIIDKLRSRAFPDLTEIADVNDVESLSRTIRDSRSIINLAAEHRDDVSPRSLYDEVNVGGAKNVCKAAGDRGIEKIIFTSSVAVYGFAPLGTDERGVSNPFNDYGRTKMEAEAVYMEWQARERDSRSLVIIRPTVVFGEGNRGNVYNLLRQIASGQFVMIGDGRNLKSMAYVENVAAFIEHSLNFGPGVHIYNYVDKPDFDMNTLVSTVLQELGRVGRIRLRLPYAIGYGIGKLFDLAAAVSGRTFPISSIRVKKFCSDTMFETSVARAGFIPPVPLSEGLRKTIQYEFIDRCDGEVFLTE